LAAGALDTNKDEEDSSVDAATSSDTSAYGQVAEEKPEESSNEVKESVSGTTVGFIEAVSDPARAVSGAVSDRAEKMGEAVSDAKDAVIEAVSGTTEVVSEPAEAVKEELSPEAESKKAVSDAKEPAEGVRAAGPADAEEGVEHEEKRAEEEKVGRVAEKEEDEEKEGSTGEVGGKVEEATRAIKQALAPGTQEAASPEAGVITLLYESGWENAYLHYSAEGGSWTELPGVAFDHDIETNTKIIRVPAASIQFVVTNGAGGWDTPPYGGNYSISSSGTYKLSYGTISEVAQVATQ
jgi:hypothetical protein